MANELVSTKVFEAKVCVVGLGYVGLPLALAFGQKMRTVGFDINQKKIDAYLSGRDPSRELPAVDFEKSKLIEFTSNPQKISECDFIILAVPTPIDHAKRPDLTLVEKACAVVGQNLSKNSIIVLESTVYPGVTEEFCAPLLEKYSGLKRGQDFKMGYSPERINPGDQQHRLENVVKVVSGEDEATLERVAAVYGSVITAGVFKAASIKVAEAAKVIENTQRDLNIALMNELAIIFDKMDLDTADVLQAAQTKWNFLPFRPGLVGGHCIGVDPYYLTYRAETLNYHPQVILAGRKINDTMGKFVAEKTIKCMAQEGLPIKGSQILVLGLTFKENCTDIRNSRVIDIVREFETYGCKVLVWDPIANHSEVREEYGLELIDWKNLQQISAVVAAVAHKETIHFPLEELSKKTVSGNKIPFMDVKSIFSKTRLQELGFRVWRL